MSALSDLLAEVMAVTRPPRGFDASGVEALTLRYMRILREYHEDVAVKALDEWPRKHQFFPTEPELRDALNEAHAILRPYTKRPRYDDGMTENPLGATKSFIDEFRKLHPNKCAAWFDGNITRYSDCRIGTRAKFIASMVEKLTPGLIAKHGIRIVEPHRYHDNGDGTYGIEWRWA
jgi:hypothetical protein